MLDLIKEVQGEAKKPIWQLSDFVGMRVVVSDSIKPNEVVILVGTTVMKQLKETKVGS